MKDYNLVNTNITYGLFRLLKVLRKQLQEKESRKIGKKKRITKREVCKELIKRCLEKKVV